MDWYLRCKNGKCYCFNTIGVECAHARVYVCVRTKERTRFYETENKVKQSNMRQNKRIIWSNRFWARCRCHLNGISCLNAVECAAFFCFFFFFWYLIRPRKTWCAFCDCYNHFRCVNCRLPFFDIPHTSKFFILNGTHRFKCSTI